MTALCAGCAVITQKHLLAEKDLTTSSALEKAQNLETARRNAQVLKGQSPTIAMGQIFQSQLPKQSSGRGVQGGRGLACHRCGAFGHGQQDCSFLTAECQSCGKIGRIAKVCCGRGLGRAAYRGARGAAQAEETTSDNESEGDIMGQLHTLGPGKVKPFKVVQMGSQLQWR